MTVVSIINETLIVEEYKCKWEYLRFTEDFDHKATQLYMILVGAGLSFLAKGKSTLVEVISRDISIPLLAFLVIYSIFLCLLLLARYKNYNQYFERISSIEKKYCNYSPHKPEKPLFSAFRLRYLLIVITGSGCFTLFLYSIFKSFLWSVIASLMYIIILFIYSYHRSFRRFEAEHKQGITSQST